MNWTFTPNNLCHMLFGVEQRTRHGDSLTDLIENVVGKEVWDKYGIAQDPVPGTKPGSGEIYIDVTGHGENSPNVVVIGRVDRQ